MQLRFEAWAIESELPEEARVAILESARCHKAGAHRAALLFAYVGWGLTLRSRILIASCPTSVPLGKWGALQAAMQNEDKWDADVFDATQTQPPHAIFDVAPDLRQQVRYWKDRRNDCAHSKRNEIVQAHVEAFWAFIQSNLGQFVPNGSIADLFGRIERHFDPNFTQPGSSVESLVRMIASSVAHKDLPDFMRQVVPRLTTQIGTHSLRRTADITAFYDGIFVLGQPEAIDALVDFLCTELDLLADLARTHPERLIFFAGKPTTIRQLWYSQLFQGGRTDLPVFASLLRNNLIPTAEVAEANARTVQNLNGDIPSAIDAPTLVQGGWLAVLLDWAFGLPRKINDFGWGNRNAATIQWMLTREPISTDMASVLCHVFASPPFPFTVRDQLRAFFAQDAAKKAEFVAAAAQVQLQPPATLV